MYRPVAAFPLLHRENTLCVSSVKRGCPNGDHVMQRKKVTVAAVVVVAISTNSAFESCYVRFRAVGMKGIIFKIKSSQHNISQLPPVVHIKYVSDSGQCITLLLVYVIHQRGGAVGCGTALRNGRSQVRFRIRSLGFFIYLILPAVLWPTQPLTEKSTRDISWGVMAVGA